ncbi:MAG: type I restriction-modification system subunit M [Bacilli bacterium]|jgi:type I restriction enzyme M protein|nr:type I restriction-modification system subunit M [Bacilli bacterium]
MNRQQLASKIWESANKMRSKIEANEYKDYILGFIFYKFLSDKQEEYLLLPEQGWKREELIELKEEDEETVNYCKKNLGYFISFDNLFSTWLAKGKDFDVSNVRDALSAFSRLISPTHQKVFNKIFDTLQTGLSKLGDSSGAQTKAISDLIHLINDIPMDGKQGYDVLGFIYEYLISMFAANAGKKAGEFYTPHEVSLLMSEIVANHLKDKKEIEIYDPTSGSGSLLINIGRSVAKHMNEKNKIKYYAQELKENTYNLTRMNLVMRGILPSNIYTRNADTLEEDWPYFDESDPNRTYSPLYVDAVVSNPPYSQHWDPTDKENDARYKSFGLAPKSKADYAFLLHDLFHVKPDGIMTIVLPHGVLFRGGEEEKIRKNLIEHNHIDAIIGLPSNIFFGTGIPTIIMVLKQKRSHSDVLIIDASKGFIKVGKNNKLQASNIKKIVDTIISRSNVDKFARVVSREEIRNNDYNLNIPRYVDSSEKAESWDVYATMFGGIPNSEIDEMNRYWKVFPNLKKNIFRNGKTPYSELISTDINDVVNNNEEFKRFIIEFNETFANFESYLNDRLINKISEVERSKEEQIISDYIFERLANIPLIDRYQAYQVLDDAWKQIEVDLEIIHTESTDEKGKVDATKILNVLRQVDPLMILKKKGDKEEEVQNGWVGRIIPFELVQKSLLSYEMNLLKSKEDKLAEIANSFVDLLDSLTEEDKEGEYVSEDKTSFVAAEVKKYIKENIEKRVKYDEDSLECKIIEANKLFEEEKILKKEIKELKSNLELHTKATIENLSSDQAYHLLKLKWVDPIVSSLSSLPDLVVNEFESKVKALVNKYSTTYLDIENQLKETIGNLTNLIDDLEGDEFDMKGLEEFKKLLGGD